MNLPNTYVRLNELPPSAELLLQQSIFNENHTKTSNKQQETASNDHLSYRLTLHILNTKPIDVSTILPKILTCELSINIHALNAKDKHILIYGQTHQLSPHKQRETASDGHLSYRLIFLTMAK